MTSRVETAGLVLVVGALLACGASTEQLKTRAAFDLKCPEDQINLVEIDSRTKGVSGCGQQATYVESCDAPPDNMARDCTWVLNSPGR
jgi:hypothetical protein